MGQKLSEWKLKMSDNIEARLAKLNGLSDKAASKFSKLQDSLNFNKSDILSENQGLGRGFDLLSNKSMLLGAGIAAAGTALYKSTELAVDFEKGMAKINATAQLSPEKLAALKNELKGIGEESGGNFERIPDAFERINSSLNNVNKSMAVMKVANKAAQTGFVDIDLAAGALAQTMSILGKRGNASEIADVMFGAKKAGNAEFADFANYLPSLIAAADNLNVNYKSISGAFAYMTGKFSASDSTMYLQNMLTAMGKSDIQDGFKKQGINLFNKDGSMKELDEFFGELGARLNGMSAEQKSNWLEMVGLKDAQAKTAFSAMAGDAKQLKAIMADVKNSVGEMNKQFDVTANHSRTWGDIGDQFKSWGVTIGDTLLPVIDALVSGVTGFANGLKNIVSADWWHNFFGADDDKKVLQKDIDQKAAMEGAQAIFQKKYGFSVSDKSQKFTGEHNKFYQDAYHAMQRGQNGEDVSSTFAAKDTGGGLKNKDGSLMDFHKEKKSRGSHLKSGIDGISGGGKTVRNINVTIHKMVEKFEVHAANLKESAPQVVANIEEQLLRAINGAEMSLTNE